jgi:hypothetical protein
MKAVLSSILVLALAFSAALPVPTYAEPRQVIQGTEIHLTLLTPVNSSTSREGDPVIAVLAQPVSFESRIILPAGTRLLAAPPAVQPATQKFLPLHDQAYMNLAFKNIEIDSRRPRPDEPHGSHRPARVDSYSSPRHV